MPLFPVLDNVIGKIEKRFSNANSNIIHALNPSSPTFLRKEAVLLLAEAYESNIEDLKYELHQTRRVLDRTRGKRKVLPLKWSLHSVWSHIRMFFYELFRLCKIAVVLPVGSASN